jgi:hypothetical protein
MTKLGAKTLASKMPWVTIVVHKCDRLVARVKYEPYFTIDLIDHVMRLPRVRLTMRRNNPIRKGGPGCGRHWRSSRGW